MLKRMRAILAIIIALCLILCLNVIPVNADSTQGDTNMVVPQLPSPPAGFNPLTATARQLKEYGFPAKPSDATSLAEWTHVMSYAKYYEKGTLTPTVNTISSDSDSSPNWAGYVIQSTPNNGTIYSQAWGDWTQPPAVSGTRPACWVGVGGYTQPNFVVQAGAISNTTSMPGAVRAVEFAVEDYQPNGGGVIQLVSSPVINGGDELYAQVMYGGATSTAFLLDFRTYAYNIVSFATQYYSGLSAEYIYEPLNNMYSTGLFIPFRACAYVDSNGIAGNLSNSNYTKVIIPPNEPINNGAYPTDVTNSNFYVIVP
jgi:hypothetical protein